MFMVLLLQMVEGDGIGGGGRLIYNRVLEGGQGVGIILWFFAGFLFHLCFFPLFSHVLCPFVLSD